MSQSIWHLSILIQLSIYLIFDGIDQWDYTLPLRKDIASSINCLLISHSKLGYLRF